MTDLYLGLTAMAGVTVAVLAVTVYCTRPLTRRAATAAGGVVGLLLAAYLVFAWNTTLLANVLPVTSLVIVGNWFPPVAAFLAGITWTHGYGTKSRRVLFGGTLLIASCWSLVSPLMGATPNCDDQWDLSGVCRQSSLSTCTPAAAATLLKHYGVPAEESEMAELCLTRRDGTTWQGLYRGLRLKTTGRRLRVEVLECHWNELPDLLDGPAILAVGIEAGKPYPEIYSRQWGWQPGIRHSVVLREFTSHNRIVIADPAVGKEIWTMGDLQTLFLGRVVRLVPDTDAL